MSQRKIQTTTNNIIWNINLRVRVNDIVEYNSSEWINLTGKNTEPGTSNDWLILEAAEVKRIFNYETPGYARFTFPANSNIVVHSNTYGPYGAIANVDYGDTNFITFLGDNTMYNQTAFIAPFDMKLINNRSHGGYSASWAEFPLRFMLGYYEEALIAGPPGVLKTNPTVVLDKTYVNTGGVGNEWVTMFEEITSSVIIPKGAHVVYTYAHERAFSINGYIKTGLTFEAI